MIEKFLSQILNFPFTKDFHFSYNLPKYQEIFFIVVSPKYELNSRKKSISKIHKLAIIIKKTKKLLESSF